MTIPSEKANNIYNAFYRFVRDGEKAEIEPFSKDDIEATQLQYSADRNSGPYLAMQKRIEELKNIENLQRQSNDKWKDRAIGFVSAIIVLIIGILIKWIFGL
jgi:hypothetical protein